MYFSSINQNLDRNKLAMFDLDYTLIKTKSGKTFPVNKNDWTWLYTETPKKLEELYNDNYSIIIISNQLGISLGKTNIEDFKFKITKIRESLKIPINFFVATHDDKYRKPRIGFWKLLLKKNTIDIDKSECFYVGDMAGRIKSDKFKKDRSDSDRKFAKNAGIKFYTPEEFFLGESERKWEYEGYLLDYKQKNKLDMKQFNGNKKMILISGYPGSGKTTLAKTFESYELFSKDLHGRKIKKLIEDKLKENKNVIIEGLLYNYEKRKPYIDLANKYNYKIKFINLTTSFDMSLHMNKYRSLKNDVEKVPKVVYYTYRKNYQEPINKYYENVINYHPSFSKKINKYFL
jgi:bifunctional polynucleotide phosphatase/kinase